MPLSKQYSFNLHLAPDLCKAVSELHIFLRKLFKSKGKMFPRCFRYHIKSYTWVQKEVFKKCIMGEAKSKTDCGSSYQKMNSQVLEGIKECKRGINLFVQREHREGKWPSNFVSLLFFSAVMEEIFCCFINTVLVLYLKHITLPPSMKKMNSILARHSTLFKNSAILFVWAVVVFRQ